MEPELLKVIKKFDAIKKDEQSWDSGDAFDTVKELQSYLNTKFPCDVDTLLTFSDMYRQDDFKKNIDTMSSEGTAEFIAKAIEYYCYLS